MVNVATLVDRVERQNVKKSSSIRSVDITQSTPKPHQSYHDGISSDESCQIVEIVEDGNSKNNGVVAGALVREEVKQHVDRLRVQVEMMSMANEQHGVVEAQETNVDQLFTCREDFRIRDDTIKYADGSEYTGQVLGKNLKHGKGVYRDASGAIYSGEFKYDIVEGKAKARMTDGSTYDGDWVAGNPHGVGKSMYPSGGTYEGDFVNGGRHGWGIMTFLNGDVYEGEWEDDKIHGQGRWTYSADSSYFQGTFERGARVYGTFASKDGSEEYQGEWQGMAKHGKGKLYVKHLGTYNGTFKNNVADGQGIFKYIDGSVYEGAFENGVRCGQGTLKLGDSFSYHGHWKQDAMHGQGYLIENGNKYFGEFCNGKKQGKGKMIYQNGTEYEGEWKNDQREGHGKCRYDNGDLYIGEWKDNKRHGQGKCKFSDGTTFRGTWEEDGWVQSGADPAQTRVAGAGIVRAQAGKISKFIIQARDSLGNKRLSGGDEFQVQLVLHGQCGNPELSNDDIVSVTGMVKDNADGTYEVTYQSRVSGVYELSILNEITQEHVSDSPYPVRVLPGPPCFAKSLFRKVEHSIPAGQSSEFEVLVRDVLGNCCSGRNWQDAIRYDIFLQGASSFRTGITSLPTGDGRLICSYVSPSEPGFYRICIEDDKGNAAPGTPFAVTVVSNASTGEDKESVVVSEATGLSNSSKWEHIAKASYMAIDGNATGWDSDEEDAQSKKDLEHASSNPDVPVVENLEDLWLVSKLQQERKRKEEKEKQNKLESMKAQLEDIYGAPTDMPTMEEAQNALKEIVLNDSNQLMKDIMANSPHRKRSVTQGKGPQHLSSLAASLDDLA